ncbi:hypothetical protein Bbelb_209670 [Branchiostoma belcheri]|nr:hypothetical protein Bbelb_209670 [Branchiostoma belcheri]
MGIESPALGRREEVIGNKGPFMTAGVTHTFSQSGPVGLYEHSTALSVSLPRSYQGPQQLLVVGTTARLNTIMKGNNARLQCDFGTGACLAGCARTNKLGG